LKDLWIGSCVIEISSGTWASPYNTVCVVV